MKKALRRDAPVFRVRFLNYNQKKKDFAMSNEIEKEIRVGDPISRDSIIIIIYSLLGVSQPEGVCKCEF